MPTIFGQKYFTDIIRQTVAQPLSDDEVDGQK